jgi:hypothetical protein
LPRGRGPSGREVNAGAWRSTIGTSRPG